MSNLLYNAWTVGIVGGIISGLIVFFVTQTLFDRRGDQLRARNIEAANRDVLMTLRPVIAEEGKVSRDVSVALIEASARKWSLRPSEMYSPYIFGQELIKEVMDSSFINHATKQKYCANIAECLLLSEGATRIVPAQETIISEEETDEKLLSKRMSILKRLMSVVLGLSTGITTAAVAFFVGPLADYLEQTIPKPDGDSLQLQWLFSEPLWPLMFVVSIPMVTSVAIIFIMNIIYRPLPPKQQSDGAEQ